MQSSCLDGRLELQKCFSDFLMAYCSQQPPNKYLDFCCALLSCWPWVLIMEFPQQALILSFLPSPAQRALPGSTTLLKTNQKTTEVCVLRLHWKPKNVTERIDSKGCKSMLNFMVQVGGISEVVYRQHEWTYEITLIGKKGVGKGRLYKQIQMQDKIIV